MLNFTDTKLSLIYYPIPGTILHQCFSTTACKEKDPLYSPGKNRQECLWPEITRTGILKTRGPPSLAKDLKESMAQQTHKPVQYYTMSAHLKKAISLIIH